MPNPKTSQPERELAIRIALSEASGSSGVLARLPDLIDILGEEATMRLLTFFGGQTIKLPRAMDFFRVLLDTGAVFSVIKDKVPVSEAASNFKMSPTRLSGLLSAYNEEVACQKRVEDRINHIDDQFTIKQMTS